MGKRSVTLHRHVNSVESIKLFVDDDLDIESIDELQAHDLIQEAKFKGTCFSDSEIIEVEYPHAVTVGDTYFEFSEYFKENG